MSPVARRPRAARSGAATPAPPDGLAELGLARGAKVRFRRREGEKWIPGVVTGRERDGSLGLADGRGRARAIALDRVEVEVPGPRGGKRWVAVADWAAETQQLRLL